MTTPALLRLREALPGTHLALLTRAKLADLWKAHPALNEVITIAPGESVWSVGGTLRAQQFDTVLILPNSPRSAIEMWLAGIPRRIGYPRPWRNFFLTQVVPSRPGHVRMRKRRPAEIRQLLTADVPGSAHAAWSPEAHQMHDYLRLAGVLGANPAPVSPMLAVQTDEVAAAFRTFNLPAQTLLVGLNAGAEYGPAKRWPADRFLAAARGIQQRTGCHWVILGGPADTPSAAAIAGSLQQAGVQTHNLAGRTTLRELMAVLTRCRALLTNDTGPMHVAAALGVPVVVPFGSTSPELTGPGLPGDRRHHLIRSDAPCSPCFLRECPIDFRCMTGISVERVVSAVMQGLAGGQDATGHNR
jgi:heptosyltransferase-2